MGLVDGIVMKTEHISKRHLTAAWKTLSNKPMPKVKALKLSDEDFNRVLRRRQCVEDDFREIEEWGRILSTHGTDACVFSGGDEIDDVDYIILVRANPYHRLDEIIVHELSHIVRGDL
ncbi:hypothetical protein E4G67_05485 [Candidatus Bathyarchaeota archaeon]|nr:MAG: hypothetical protein E4G67_05485 [Candidatus Bathyarchaeota archaeon]